MQWRAAEAAKAAKRSGRGRGGRGPAHAPPKPPARRQARAGCGGGRGGGTSPAKPANGFGRRGPGRRRGRDGGRGRRDETGKAAKGFAFGGGGARAAARPRPSPRRWRRRRRGRAARRPTYSPTPGPQGVRRPQLPLQPAQERAVQAPRSSAVPREAAGAAPARARARAWARAWARGGAAARESPGDGDDAPPAELLVRGPLERSSVDRLVVVPVGLKVFLSAAASFPIRASTWRQDFVWPRLERFEILPQMCQRRVDDPQMLSIRTRVMAAR